MVSLCTSGTRFTRKVCLWSSRDIQRTDIEILPGRSARMHCYICNSKLGSPCSERINRHGYSRREGWFKWFRSKPSPATHFSERFNVVRIYNPAGHRHTAEVIQVLSMLSGKNVKVGMSVHAVNMVRGLETTSHVISERTVDLKELWRMYRQYYADKPFIRIIRDKKGKSKYPDPKFTFGSNYADVGFEIDSNLGRILSIGALDNLVKGAAGNAVQCANIMLGLKEEEGLLSAPIYPA